MLNTVFTIDREKFALMNNDLQLFQQTYFKQHRSNFLEQNHVAIVTLRHN